MPKLNKKYVDDILVMFQSRDHVKKLIDYMNTKQANMFYIWNRRSK